MIRLDRRLTPTSPVSICVFCVFCGSIKLAYCQHNLSNSLTSAERRDKTAYRGSDARYLSLAPLDRRWGLTRSASTGTQASRSTGNQEPAHGPRAPTAYPSHRRHTAIHEQQRAINVRSIIRCQNRMNFAGCASSLVPAQSGLPDREEMEPQNTQNTQKAVVRYRSSTTRLISRRGLPKLSSRHRRRPVAFR